MQPFTLVPSIAVRMLCRVGALLLLLIAQPVVAQPVCSSGCSGPCTLTYRASGVVRDNVTGNPISGAQITLLDLNGVSGADGSFSLHGSKADTCHFDYFYSFSVAADGYETHHDSGYATGITINYEVRLNPEGPSGGHVVSGVVTEFPPCNGAMRGVTVILEPLNITTQTSVDANDGGRFAFTDVPPGEYTVRVVEGCNPFGCWEPFSFRLGDDSIEYIYLCPRPTGPSPSSTPTPTAFSGPTATFTVCPMRTPCRLGERPQYCEDNCYIGCGCEECPECPDGFVSAPRANVCECIPDPNVTPPPTPTPGGCLFPTPPLCPYGQTTNCPHVPCGTTDQGCFCEACPACPDGSAFDGNPNSCRCVNPQDFTPTPLPGAPTPTPTSNPCPFATPPLCPIGQTPHCVSNDCIVGCSCEPCGACPEGWDYSGEQNRCECVNPNAPPNTPTPTPNRCELVDPVQCSSGGYLSCDPDCTCRCLPCADCPTGLERDGIPGSCACIDPRTPSERPTATPTPVFGVTPPACPTRTPLLCDVGEASVCDTSVDPCGICECRAVPQQPAGGDRDLTASSSSGCEIAPNGARTMSWPWLILGVGAVAVRAARRRT